MVWKAALQLHTRRLFRSNTAVPCRGSKIGTTIMPLGFLNLEVTARNTERLLTGGRQEDYARLLFPRLPKNERSSDYDHISVSRCSRIRSSANRPGERHGPIWVANRKLGNGNHPPSRRWHNPRINWRNPFRLGAGRSRHSGYLDQTKATCAVHLYGTTLRIFDPGMGAWSDRSTKITRARSDRPRVRTLSRSATTRVV